MPSVRTASYTVLPGRFRARARNIWHFVGKRRALIRARASVPRILTLLQSLPDLARVDEWNVQRAFCTEAMVVLSLGSPGGPSTIVLKLPLIAAGETSLRRQQAVLAELRSQEALREWCHLLPTPLLSSTIDGRFFAAERALPGISLLDLMRSRTSRSIEAVSAPASVIAEFHRLTARTVTIGTDHLVRWIDEPVRFLTSVSRNHRALSRLISELHSALDGRRLAIGWIHGDYWAGNLLVDPDNLTVSGILDWDLAAPDELPLHDLINLSLSTETVVRDQELGDIIRMRLQGEGWTDQEKNLSELAPTGVDATSWRRAILLLFWLRFVATYLTKLPWRARDSWWMGRNVEGVLKSL